MTGATTQESARRIGICLVDYEMFWWRCDDGEPCPVCSLDDDQYVENHRFYVAENSEQSVSGVSSAS